MDNEDIVYEGRLSIACLIISVLWDLILCCIFIGFWFLIRDFIVFFTTKLKITNKRVSGHVGLFNTNDLDSPLNKITGIQVIQNIFGKIFNYGTIKVTTASNSFNYKFIDNPGNFRKKLNDQIEIYDDERIEKQAKKLAESIK